MEMLTGLLTQYPATAITVAAVLLLAAVLPFAGRRSPRVFLILLAAPISLITTPFVFWRRNVQTLATITLQRIPEADGGRSILTPRFLTAIRAFIVVGGIFILTTGILTGLRASRGQSNEPQRTAMLEAELPLLERTLEETRSGIEALDREWDLALARYAEAHRQRFAPAIGELDRTNAGIEQILSGDPSTREIFLEFRNASAAAGSSAKIIGRLEAFLPTSTLIDGRKALLLQYFRNARARERMAALMDAPRDSPARHIFQPDYERLVRLRVELPAAIARIRSDLELPDEQWSFNPGAFLAALAPAVILFCAFIWAMGFLIDIFGVLLHPVAPQKGTQRGKSPEIDSTGKLIWAE